MITIYAIQNDTVDAICWRNYGRSAGVVEAVLEQNVHITAEFPNATNKDEILSAFDNVVNLASQYANRKR